MTLVSCSKSDAIPEPNINVIPKADTTIIPKRDTSIIPKPDTSVIPRPDTVVVIHPDPIEKPQSGTSCLVKSIETISNGKSYFRVYTYDSLARVTRVNYNAASGLHTDYIYTDYTYQLDKITSSSEPGVGTYELNDDGKIIIFNQSTSFRYNSEGYLIETEFNGVITTFNYQNGNLVRIADVDQKGKETTRKLIEYNNEPFQSVMGLGGVINDFIHEGDILASYLGKANKNMVSRTTQQINGPLNPDIVTTYSYVKDETGRITSIKTTPSYFNSPKVYKIIYQCQ